MLDFKIKHANIRSMRKADAIALFGDTQATADALGISYSAVSQWPDQLPERISDRVLGAAWREGKLPQKPEPSNKRRRAA